MESACGGAGMSVADFWDSTLRDVNNVIRGFEAERTHSLKWLRWQTATLINIHIDKKNRLKPTDLFTTADEKPEKPANVDPEKQAEMIRKWDAEIAKKFNVNTNGQ